MRDLSPAETETAARVFNHLVTPSRTKIAHSVPDLANYAGVSPDVLAPLLQKMSAGENRILTPVAPAPDQPAHLRYQILHDVLAASILEWRASYVRGRERVEAQMQAEGQRRRADQEAAARIRLRRLSILLLVTALVASGFGWAAMAERRNAEKRRMEAEAAQLEAIAAKHLAQAGRLELEAANQARSAAERQAELNRLRAEAASAELKGALESATELRERAAEKKVQVDTERAALMSLKQEAQRERKSAASTQTEVERLRGGVDSALLAYRTAYHTLDTHALVRIYPRLPNDRKKHLRQSRDACQGYEVGLTPLQTYPCSGDSVTVAAQSSYQCAPKGGGPPATTVMREDFWLRREARGGWIIDTITGPRPDH